MFIALEGIDGSGKSTVAERLVAEIRGSGRAAVLTREPGGTLIGEAIRDVLLHARSQGMTPEAEVLLFAASRAQLVADVIRPALSNGAVVVSDRYVDSSLAYQWGGRCLARDQVDAVQGLATDGLQPDLKLLLDLPVDVAQERRFADDAQANRLDRESRSFHERVHAAYHALAAADPGRWKIIDAEGPPARVWSSVVRAVNETGLLCLDVDFETEPIDAGEAR